MQKNILFTLMLLLAGAGSTIAQSYAYQHESLPQLNKKFTIVAHIFPDSTGIYSVTEQDIKDATAGMNVYFDPIKVSFEFCEFRYHPNYEHDTLNTENEMALVETKFHADHRINFYFVSRIRNDDPSGLAAGAI